MKLQLTNHDRCSGVLLGLNMHADDEQNWPRSGRLGPLIALTCKIRIISNALIVTKDQVILSRIRQARCVINHEGGEQ